MHPLADGTPIAVAAARALVSGLPGSVAVVRSANSRLARMLKAEGLRIAVCREAREGMGRSLAAGVRATREASGWVVALADMPFVRAATIALVVENLRKGAAIAAPAYRGERGHPVGFARRWQEELEALHGDSGARGLLRAQADRITLLDVEDAGVIRDIDTHGDLPQ